ncbi:hypothetical protein F5144DRAFT_582105, partial [Chaetomium tenue]
MDAGRSQRLKSGMSASSTGLAWLVFFVFLSPCYEFSSALAPVPFFQSILGANNNTVLVLTGCGLCLHF